MFCLTAAYSRIRFFQASVLSVQPILFFLRAFIDRIEVSHVDKKSRTREITIVYNFIGAFDFTRAIENARNTSKKEQRTA